MKDYSYEVYFFLDESENKTFTEYCKTVGVQPYMVGQQMVKDFLMSDDSPKEQPYINVNYEARIATLENRVEDMIKMLSTQIEKSEKLEEHLACIQSYTDCKAENNRLESVELRLDNLQDDYYDSFIKLQNKVT